MAEYAVLPPAQGDTTVNRRSVVFSGAAVAAGTALGASPEGGRSSAQLLRRPYMPSDGTGEREYYLYVPIGFHTEAGRRWPVMLFLHGNGERGDGRADLKYTMQHGPLMEAWIQGRDLPFLIIQPQLPWYSRRRPERERPEPPERNENGPPPPRSHGRRSEEEMIRKETGEKPRWGDEGLPDGWPLMEKDLLSMVDSTIADYRGDPDRVYVTGLSYGGFGTWHMAAAYSGRWAAAAPICGAGSAGQAKRIAEARLPVWIFQGGRDPVVKAEHVLESARNLEAAGHPEVRMTVHEDLGHNVWVRVYEGWDLYNWFLQIRRNSPRS